MNQTKVAETITFHSSCDALVLEIKKANTFDNPKHKANDFHGYSNWQTPSIIETFHINNNGSISVPRGYFPELLKLCKEFNIDNSIEDLRSVQPVSFPELNGITFYPYQEYAINQALQSDQGVLVSPTGSGKSLIGLEIIRQRGQRTLIIVHRKELATQWMATIKKHMGLEAGLIGNGEWTIGDQITIALVQTLATRLNEIKAFSNAFGLVLLDETHHAPASTIFEVISLLAAKYRYGLSATPNRRDGLEPMIYLALGPVIANISREEVEGLGSTVPTKVISIQTGFNPGLVNSWNEYLDTLTTNINRNTLILDLAQKSNGSILILVDRISHAEQLSEKLNERNIDHVLAHGKISKNDRENVIERIKSAQITIGTTSLLGEGLDVSVWSVLIMGAPISSEIKLMQAIGRIVRPALGKEISLVYDLKDDCGFSGASFKKRFEIYKKNKIWVEFKKAA